MIKSSKINTVVCDKVILFFTEKDIENETPVIGYYYDETFKMEDILRNSKYGLYIQTHMKEGR